MFFSPFSFKEHIIENRFQTLTFINGNSCIFGKTLKNVIHSTHTFIHSLLLSLVFSGDSSGLWGSSGKHGKDLEAYILMEEKVDKAINYDKCNRDK